ncbi:MAG: hypothetical protein AB7E47_12295 [Desulfovibrionaceae bacterium]
MAETGSAIASGVGQAVTKGGQAAGKAVAKAADVVANDPHMREAYKFGGKVAAGAATVPAVVAAAALAGTKAIPAAASWALANPHTVNKAIEYGVDILSPTPPSTGPGILYRAGQELSKFIPKRNHQ